MFVTHINNFHVVIIGVPAEMAYLENGLEESFRKLIIYEIFYEFGSLINFFNLILLNLIKTLIM